MIKKSKLFQILGFSWLICLVSHVIIPIIIGFPIFYQLTGHLSEDHSFFEFLIEMGVFTLILIPSSIFVTVIYHITKRRKHVDRTLKCESCPHKEQAFEFVERHCHGCYEEECHH